MKRALTITLMTALLVMNAGCSKEEPVESEAPVVEQEVEQTEPESEQGSEPSEDVAYYTENQLLPVEETSQDATLEAYVVKLKKVIEERDIEAFKTMVDPNIKLSFGGDGGVDQIESFWSLDTQEGQDQFWGELKIMIDLGGVSSSNSATYPYVFEAFPVEFDSFMYMAVTSDKVEMYASSDTNSKILYYLSYNVVEYVDMVGDYKAPDFYKIRLEDGTEGFVKGDLCRSPIDYRLGLTKTDDTWEMTFLVSGD